MLDGSVADWRAICSELQRQERAAALAGALQEARGDSPGLASLLAARETLLEEACPQQGSDTPGTASDLPRPPAAPPPLPPPAAPPRCRCLCPPATAAGNPIEAQRLVLERQTVIAGHLAAVARAQLAAARLSESAAPAEVAELEEELSIAESSLETLAAAAKAAGQS